MNDPKAKHLYAEMTLVHRRDEDLKDLAATIFHMAKQVDEPSRYSQEVTVGNQDVTVHWLRCPDDLWEKVKHIYKPVTTGGNNGQT